MYSIKIILDSLIDITDKISSFSIESAKDSFCKELSFEISDEDFYDTLDFSRIPENPRIEIFTSIETDDDYNLPIWISQGKFFIERPTYSVNCMQTNTGVWGRQSTAVLNEPFAQKITKLWEENTTVHTIFQEILESVGLTWNEDYCNIPNYNIFADTFEASDQYPIEVLKSLIGLILGESAFITSDTLGNIHFNRLIRKPVDFDYDITDSIIQTIQEEPEWPEFGNRIKIIPNTTVSQNKVVLSTDYQCLGTGATKTITAFAQAMNGDNTPLDNVTINWSFEPSKPKDVWYKYPWYPKTDMKKTSVQTTARMLISKEAAKATGFTSVTLDFIPDEIIGIWGARDSVRQTNFAFDKTKYVIDGRDVHLIDQSFLYCDQSLLISYYAKGMVKNQIVYDTETGYEVIDPDLVYGEVSVIASISGKDTVKPIYVNNSCQCKTELEAWANPVEISAVANVLNIRTGKYEGNPAELPSYTTIYAFLSNSGIGLNYEKLKMVEVTTNGSLEWEEGITNTILVENEIVDVETNIQLNSAWITLSGVPEDVVGIWKKKTTALERYANTLYSYEMSGKSYSWQDSLLYYLGRQAAAEQANPTPAGANLFQTYVETDMPSGWLKVRATLWGQFAIAIDGRLFACGDNYDDGRTHNSFLGLIGPAKVVLWTQVGTDTDWEDIAEISYGTLALKKNGTLWATGAYLNNFPKSSGFVKIGNDANWDSISRNIAIKTTGKAWGINQLKWYKLIKQGENQVEGKLATFDSLEAVLQFEEIDGDDWEKICDGFSSSNYAATSNNTSPIFSHQVGIKKDGTLWGRGLVMVQKYSSPFNMDEYDPPINYQRYGTGNSLGLGGNEYFFRGFVRDDSEKDPVRHSLLTAWIKRDGPYWSYGNYYKTSVWVLEWTQIGTDNDWKDVSCGDFVTYALKNDGTMWATGGFNYGQPIGHQLNYGLYGIQDTYVFTQIGTDTDWATVQMEKTVGVFATKTDGSLWGNLYDKGWKQISAGPTGHYFKQCEAHLGYKDTSSGIYLYPYNYYGISDDNQLYVCGMQNWRLGLGEDTDRARVPTLIDKVYKLENNTWNGKEITVPVSVNTLYDVSVQGIDIDEVIIHIMNNVELLVDFYRAGGVKQIMTRVAKYAQPKDTVASVTVSANVNTEEGLSKDVNVSIIGWTNEFSTPSIDTVAGELPETTYEVKVNGPTTAKGIKLAVGEKARLGPWTLMRWVYVKGKLARVDFPVRNFLCYMTTNAGFVTGYAQLIVDAAKSACYIEYDANTPSQEFQISLWGDFISPDETEYYTRGVDVPCKFTSYKDPSEEMKYWVEGPKEIIAEKLANGTWGYNINDKFVLKGQRYVEGVAQGPVYTCTETTFTMGSSSGEWMWLGNEDEPISTWLYGPAAYACFKYNQITHSRDFMFNATGKINGFDANCWHTFTFVNYNYEEDVSGISWDYYIEGPSEIEVDSVTGIVLSDKFYLCGRKLYDNQLPQFPSQDDTIYMAADAFCRLVSYQPYVGTSPYPAAFFQLRYDNSTPTQLIKFVVSGTIEGNYVFELPGQVQFTKT